MRLSLALLSAFFLIHHTSSGQTKQPFQGIDATWQNGSDRRDSAIITTPFFTPSVLLDINYSYSFNNPIDNTVIGSTALARDNEVELSALHFGGDFTYGPTRARIMTQFGTRSSIVPRNDMSVYRGQYDLANVYKYLSEAYAGYHFDVMHGLNIDAGLFMSYIGLNSYYQQENWEYQASFTSDNTPWFFNGLRVQLFPTNSLKVEAWLINGWQSYGKFNSMPGIGGSVSYLSPNSNWKLISNDYYGADAAGIPSRIRVHSDNSLLHRYYHQPKARGISGMACSLTGDIGFEDGGGVTGFSGPKATQQYFLSCMFYNRIWFKQNKFAWTIGGGAMKNPGRYLILAPTGQSSPLPDPNNPTTTIGKFPFTLNIGDQFQGWDWSTNLDYMPTQNMTFRIEYVSRMASVPYFNGKGGVTSQTGLSYTPLDPNWRPDLVKTEQRIILVVLFRI